MRMNLVSQITIRSLMQAMTRMMRTKARLLLMRVRKVIYY